MSRPVAEKDVATPGAGASEAGFPALRNNSSVSRLDIRMDATTTIRLRRFTRDSDQLAFHSHLRLKYAVFVDEQSWPLAADTNARQAAEDAADPYSCFVQAIAGEDVVGTVRGTRLDQAFPHQGILKHHLERGGLSLELSELATLNSVAVRADLRGEKFPVAGFPQPLTIAKAMVCELVEWFREQRTVAVIFTAILGVSSVFFEHLGAYVIDPPFQLGDVAFRLVNMALLTVDPERFDEQRSPLAWLCPRTSLDQRQLACVAYGRQRHREILAGRTMEQLSFGGDMSGGHESRM